MLTLIWLPVLAAVAVVGARVIGVRVGWWRAVLTASLGLATAYVALGSLDRKHPEPAMLLVIVLGLLAMMGWVCVFELVSKSRPGPRRHLEINPRRALRHTVARGLRRVQIAVIVLRFGLRQYGQRNATEPHGSATGRALRGALERAGGVYVKLGQFLSTRSDLLPIEITAELRELQSHVDQVPMALIYRTIAEELGEVDHVFVSFNAEPAAAASLAQVHEAALVDGRRVAVKIQRPDVAKRVHCDLDILVRLAERLERRTKWALEMQLMAAVEGFAENVIGELDFEAEARHLHLIKDAVGQHSRFVVPEPVTHLTSRRLLVMEWIDGVPLSQASGSLADAERCELARELLQCFLDQILVVGVFHADPHPGNLVLTANHRIALIDCGAIGMLDRRQRSALQAVLVAIGAQDPERLRVALRLITTTNKPIDEPQLERRLGLVLTHHVGSGISLGAEFLTALMELLREFGLAMEPFVGGALRALAALQSTLESLNPKFDLLAEARTYGYARANPLWSSAHPRTTREELEAHLPNVLPTLVNLPRRLDHIVQSVERNDFSIGVHFPSERDRRLLNKVTAQLVAPIVAAAFGLIGALLILGINDPPATDTGRVLQGIGIGCVGLSLLLLSSALIAALRQRRQ